MKKLSEHFLVTSVTSNGLRKEKGGAERRKEAKKAEQVEDRSSGMV